MVAHSEHRLRRRIEGVSGVTEHDARSRQAVDGSGPLGVVGVDIGEALIAGFRDVDAGHLCGPGQEQRHLRTGHVAQGVERVSRRALGDPVVGQTVDALEVNVVVGHVGEAVAFCGRAQTRPPHGNAVSLPRLRRGGARPGNREDRSDQGTRGEHCPTRAPGFFVKNRGQRPYMGRQSVNFPQLVPQRAPADVPLNSSADGENACVRRAATEGKVAFRPRRAARQAFCGRRPCRRDRSQNGHWLL